MKQQQKKLQKINDQWVIEEIKGDIKTVPRIK
jgi:hypothetical protein